MKFTAKALRAMTVAGKRNSLRASGRAPKVNYIIIPAAGSLLGDVPSLRDNRDRTNAVADRMLASSGARRRENTV